MFMAFAALFSSIFELLIFAGAAALIYYIFLADWWRAFRVKHREAKGKFDAIEKIAQVKLVSDNKKDIEKFVTDNAQYLSSPMVAKLAARIESLNIDDIIINDDLNLKKRITELPPPPEEKEEDSRVRPSGVRN